MSAVESICRCESYAAVTERAAVARGRWLGRGDVVGAEQAATQAMRAGLDALPIDGRVVVGNEAEGDPLSIGTTVGRGASASISPSTRSRAPRSSRAATTGRWR